MAAPTHGRAWLVTLDSIYVNSSVEPGYAPTARCAQGVTGDAAFTLVRPGMAREAAYVAMTRSRRTNTVSIATDMPDPAYNGAPEPATTGRQILQQILATQRAQLSATQTLRQLHYDAESLATLGAMIHETLVQAVRQNALGRNYHRCRRRRHRGGSARLTLLRSTHRHTAPRRIRRLRLPAIVAAGPLRRMADGDSSDVTGGGRVRDAAAVLVWRVNNGDENTDVDHYDRRAGALLAGIFVPAASTTHRANDELAEATTDIEPRIIGRQSSPHNRLPSARLGSNDSADNRPTRELTRFGERL